VLFLPFGLNVYVKTRIRRLVCAVLFTIACYECSLAADADVHNVDPAPTESEQLFLDRLMAAESGGIPFATNPKSSALGPFQILASTFSDVVQRHFPELTQGKSQDGVLQMRGDPKISRNVALMYTRENAALLNAQGVTPTAGSLRLAFFAGAAGAIKVIAAKPDTPVSSLLSASSLEANPFLKGMTAGELIERSEREASGISSLRVQALAKAPGAGPKTGIRCNLKRASCRKWLYLATKRSARKEARNRPPAAERGSPKG
jgi:hypothetical protein